MGGVLFHRLALHSGVSSWLLFLPTNAPPAPSLGTDPGLQAGMPPATLGPGAERSGGAASRAASPASGLDRPASDRAGGGGSRWTGPDGSGSPVPSRWLGPTPGQLRGSGRGRPPGWGGDPVFHDNAEAERTKAPQSAFYWFELII